MKLQEKIIKDYSVAVTNIRNDLEIYIKDHKIKSLVLGISGGIDSALCAALAKPVCDKLGINLIGRFISISSNKSDERDRAIAIGKNFCTNFETVDLTDAYNAIKPVISEDDDGTIAYKIRQGNIKARMRMIYLYNLASLNSGLTLSTDNFTELMLGFWTLHGDVADLGMIQQLWKTEVYEMTEYLAEHEMIFHTKEGSDALLSCVTCNATDGLGITSTDLDQILPNWRNEHETTRSGYREVDELIDMYIATGRYPKNEKKIVSDRIVKSAFKRDNPHNFTREQITKNI